MSQIKILFIFIAVAFVIILFVSLSYVRDEEIKKSMSTYQTYHITQPLRATTNFYRQKAQSIYSLFIDKEDILELMHTVNSTQDPTVREKERTRLFEKLKDKYDVFKKVGIKQLHFHLEDTTSFLRFHKPSKFGDKLHDIRYSLVVANKEKHFVEGFEEGRIFNGYRFVFPLAYQNEHIGTVEISVGFNAIAKDLHQEFNLQPYMVLRDDVVKEKVFSKEQRNYEKSFISSHYFHEFNKFDNISKLSFNEETISREEFKQTLLKQYGTLEERLDKNEFFQHYENHDQFSYILSFVPIQNIKGTYIGYIILMDKDFEYLRIHNEYFYRFILLSLLGLFLLYFIYHLEKVNHKLTASEKRALEATKSKSEFLANMSHEIRTPLNAIFGYLNLLKKMKHDPKVEKYLGVVLSSSQTLLSVINDILDFSKIESGKFSFEMSSFNTKKLFEELKQMFIPSANEKNIDLSLHYEGEIEPYVESDSTRLKQVICNLLSNAIKFTPEGGTIELRVRCRDGRLGVKVIDSGIGIIKEKQESIFLKFEQADTSTTRKFGGTGLGLAISNFIINNLGGELRVASELNKGSVFSFDIPVRISTQPDDERDHEELENDTEHFAGNVLLVEDNKTNQMMMRIILEELGLIIDVANDGLEAIKSCKKNHYDLILMDENMPNMNGIEACIEILKSQDSGECTNAIIVALTADAIEGSREKFLEAGMKDYLTKPLNEKELLRVLKKFLKSS